MKTLIAASLLLALTVPAHAAKANLKDIPLIMDWRDNFWNCRNDPEDHPKACTEADRLEKKLAARGYCPYARGAIGRTGKPWTQKEWTRTWEAGPVSPNGSRHCYAIDNLPAD